MQDMVLVLHLEIPDDEPLIETLMAIESALAFAPIKRAERRRLWTLRDDARAILDVCDVVAAQTQEDL